MKEFRKTGSSAALGLEMLKADCVRLCPAHGREYYVPKPLRLTDDNILWQERVDNFQTTVDCLVKGIFGVAEIARSLGRGLAFVHEEFHLPDIEDHRWGPLWGQDADENVYIHGDFTKANTGFVPPSLRPVFLDWSLAPEIKRSVTRGSRYFDCVLFIFDLWYTLPHDALGRQLKTTAIVSMLKGYSEVRVISEATLVTRIMEWRAILDALVMNVVRLCMRRCDLRGTRTTVALLLRLLLWRKMLLEARKLKSLSAVCSR